MYSLFKNTMSQYNNGNHINNIPVIPDYLDRRDAVDDGSFVKINKLVEEQENQNDTLKINAMMTINEEDEEEDVTEAEGEKEPKREEEELLNDEDSDELESKDKIYVISVNTIPYYYEENLKDARQQMLDLANHFAASLNDKNGPGHIYVTDHNLKHVKVIAPYSFLMLTYNHVMYEISVEYAIKLQK